MTNLSDEGGHLVLVPDTGGGGIWRGASVPVTPACGRRVLKIGLNFRLRVMIGPRSILLS